MKWLPAAVGHAGKRNRTGEVSKLRDKDIYTVVIPGVDAATATYLLETYQGARAIEEEDADNGGT